MSNKTMIVRFSAAVCVLLILFVGHAVAFCQMTPGETLTFQESRIK